MIHTAVNFDLAEVANPQTVAAVLAFAVGAIYLWRRDVNAPEKAASNSVLSDTVGYSRTIMDVAKDAALMAQEANTRAAEANKRANDAAEASIECSRRFALLIDYTRVLTGQLVVAGIQPAPMPPELTD